MVVGSLFAGFVALVVGAGTVLPVGLVLGGLAGWWVGRRLAGTRAEAGRLDPDPPPMPDA